jgi:membrane protease YdiL (CAAX protease family)
MRIAISPVVDQLGLRFNAAFISDGLFYVAVIAAPAFLTLARLLWPAWSHGIAISVATFVSMVLWQPLVEEMLFRGVLQTQLNRALNYRRVLPGLSAANVITTMIFGAAHLLHQAMPLAIAVMVPSAIFGYFRERHGHIYSALILHCLYNGLYLVS